MAEILVTPGPIDGWWVTGLVDGEGCFYADLSFRTKKTKTGREVSCVELDAQFSVVLRADDGDTLIKLQQYFGCGKVNWKASCVNAPSSIKAGMKDPKPQRRFMIRNVEVLSEVVIPHFEKYPLQSKKARDFETWKSIIEFSKSYLRGKKGWLRRFPERVVRLQGVCDQLRDGRKYRAVSEGGE
jgi:hypothetical protein